MVTGGGDVSLTWPQLLAILTAGIGVPWGIVGWVARAVFTGRLVPLGSVAFKNEQIGELKADNRELRTALKDQTGKVSGMVGQLGEAAARVRTEEQHPPTTEVV